MGTSKDYDAPRTPPWRDLKRNITRNLPNPDPLPPPDPLAPDPNPPDPNPPDPEQPQPPCPPIPPDLLPKVNAMSRTVGKFVRAQYGGGGGVGGGGAGGGGATGGGSGGAGARQSAQRVGHNLGRFFSTVATSGVTLAAEEFGIGRLEGKSTREIAMSLTDALGGPSTTVNDTDARSALARLMNELLKDVPPAEVAEKLQQVARGTDFAAMLHRFFGYYIFEQFNRMFYARLQRLNQASAAQFLKNGLHCIQWMLRNRTKNIDIRRIRWGGQEGARLVAEVMESTFQIFSAAQ